MSNIYKIKCSCWLEKELELKRIVGREYKIGKRKIRMCERVEEKVEKIIEMAESQKSERTRGTRMSKYRNLLKIISPSP